MKCDITPANFAASAGRFSDRFVEMRSNRKTSEPRSTSRSPVAPCTGRPSARTQYCLISAALRGPGLFRTNPKRSISS